MANRILYVTLDVTKFECEWVHLEPKLQLCPVHSIVRLFILNLPIALWDCTLLYVAITPDRFPRLSTRSQFVWELFNFVIQFKCSALKSKFHLLFSHQFSLLFWAHISLSGLSEFSDTLRLPLNCMATAFLSLLPPRLASSVARWNKFETMYLLMASGYCIPVFLFLGPASQRNKLTHFLIVYKFWGSHAGPIFVCLTRLGPAKT